MVYKSPFCTRLLFGYFNFALALARGSPRGGPGFLRLFSLKVRGVYVWTSSLWC